MSLNKKLNSTKKKILSYLNTDSRRIFTNFAVGLAAAVCSSIGEFDLISGDFVNSYFYDVGITAGGYAGLSSIFKVNRPLAAAAVFVIPSVLEIAQNFGLYSGTYDPKDFLAYAAGAGLALGLDVLISGKGSLEDKTEQETHRGKEDE